MTRFVVVSTFDLTHPITTEKRDHMAKKTVVIDDIDGAEGAATREFSFNGVDYEVDLTDANFAKFQKAVEKYIESGSKVNRARRSIKPGATRTHTAIGASTGRADLDAIRQWARKNGYEVSDRGRIKGEIQEAFNVAHSSQFSHAGA